MCVPTAQANGIEICFETAGSPSHPTLLLIMGLGAQLVAWPDEFCAMLASRGFFVVRFDNRDVGLSTKFDQYPADMTNPAYSLDDMADDAAGLLDALAREQAHVVGASMGGMIAQLVALRHPARVLSLTSIMSHVGGADAVPPTPEAMEVLMAPRPRNREEAIELAVRARSVIGGKGFPVDEAKVREQAAIAFDRCYHPAGFLRQIAAIMAADSRAAGLSGLRLPVTVIHGLDDPLVPPENGRRTASAIPGAELVEIEGMGHDLPEGAWPRIVDAISAAAARAEARAR